jgi:hypothetical protein
MGIKKHAFIAYMDDDRLPGARDVDLAGRGDVQILQVALKLRVVGLKVKQSLAQAVAIPQKMKR